MFEVFVCLSLMFLMFKAMSIEYYIKESLFLALKQLEIQKIFFENVKVRDKCEK